MDAMTQPDISVPATPRPEAFWIETLSRHHDVLSRQRCFATEVRIGRSYDNDIVLEDPHVAPRHLRIRRDDGGLLVAEDLGSRSGLFIDQAPESVRVARIDGHTQLRIGSTLLRVRTADYDVGPERPLLGDRGSWPLALALIAIVTAITTVDEWWGDIGELQLSRYVIRALLLLAVGGIWTTGWALTSRLFSGAMHYGRHLAIAFGAILALSVYGSLGHTGAYAFSIGGILHYTYVGSWLLFGVTCLLHLLVISRRHPLIKSIGVTLIVGLAIAAETLSQGDMKKFNGPVSVVRQLEPPVLRLKSPSSEDRFFSANETLKAGLDHARSEEQPPSGGLDSFDGDSDE
jgi:hypothetical protein